MERVIVGKHKNGNPEFGDFIPRDEYLLRLARAKETVATLKIQLLQTETVAVAERGAWLKGMVRQLLQPKAAPDQSPATSAPVDELDYSLLTTPIELLDAFGKWGMKAAWFDDLNSRQWLLYARRRKGQGQKGSVIQPLYCPFAVMNGLINNVRKVSRLNPDTAWRTLEHKFPKVYSAFEMHDPREPTGD